MYVLCIFFAYFCWVRKEKKGLALFPFSEFFGAKTRGYVGVEEGTLLTGCVGVGGGLTGR